MTPSPLLGIVLGLSSAHAGWTLSKHAEGCDYLQGSPGADGITPVRVECTWSEVDASALHRLLARPEGHASTFSGLSEARLVQREGPITRIYQRFSARGVTDREVVVDFRTEELPNGRSYRWTKSGDQSSLRGDGVEVPATEGQWAVTEQGGQVRLVYELKLKLGGMVPSFMVRWAQGGAVEQTIVELRERVGATP